MATAFELVLKLLAALGALICPDPMIWIAPCEMDGTNSTPEKRLRKILYSRHRENMRRSLAMLPFLSAVLLVAPAQAATVTTTADSGPGSLREAIATAAAGETIDFAVSGVITLTNAELLIGKDLTILGPGAGNLTIRRSTANGTPDFRIFNLQAGIGTISGLTLNNGRAREGGGINNESTFTLRDCVIVGNVATNNGGGINNLGSLTITNCVIRGNSVTGGAVGGWGGGLHNEGTFTATSSIVTSNSASGAGGTSGLGGGINNTGTMALTNSVINGNFATGDGGGNASGGGLNNEGTLTVHTSTIGFNSAVGGAGGAGGAGAGGGIANGFGSITLDRTTVSSNSAAGGTGVNGPGGAGQGGGIANSFGTVTVENSTVSGNAAHPGAGAPSADLSGGGGLFNGFGSASLGHSTVTANIAPAISGAEGGGLLNPAGVVEIKNIILAANFAAVDVFTGVSGDVFSHGFNLLGATNGPITPGPSDLFNVTATGVRLGPLQNNGGPTFTHALLCSSLAIDAGDNTNAPATDQRGFARIVRGVIDIGAYEENNTAPTISCPAPISLNGGQAATVTVNVADGDGDPLFVVWTVDGTPVQTNAVIAGGPPTTASVNLSTNFGVGVHAINVSVSDPNGCAVNCSTTVTVSGGAAGSIGVTKSCPPALIQPGRVVNVTGMVTNTGNITLTNVNVTNVIAALNGVTRRVLGPVTLAPGAGMNWTDSYIAPADSCPPYSDTTTATGTTAGGGAGVVVTASATRSCPGTNSPRLFVTRNCPLTPTAPGDIAVYSGIVSNAGNITLLNVVLVDPATSPSTVLLGPLALAPGQSVNYTHSSLVPADCCEHVTTVTATGMDKCFGRTVTDSATTICEAATDGRIKVTLACPPDPVPLGEFLVYSGVVSNAGNVALANVTVVINQPSNNTVVVGPIVLAPGEVEEFVGSYLVPFDTCVASMLNTVMARATDPCNNAIVTYTDSTECPIVAAPRLVLTKNCPANLVQPGGTLAFSGTISNAGNVTLTNVLVVNDHPTNSTPVLGPITLVPGQSTGFSGSYAVCLDCCPPYVDVLTATGTSVCGSNIATIATAACPGTNSPRIFVTKNCPPVPAAPGDLAVFSGIVSNAGNITLVNVLVAELTPNDNTVLLGPITLAPGQSSNYTASYRVPANCCAYVNTVAATGADKCFGRTVAHSATTVCQTTTDARINVTKVCPLSPVSLGEPLVFSGVVSNAGNIALVNVTVVNNLPSNNTPVLGPITLAPGETADFAGSYLVPVDTCATNLLDTVTARGINGCNGVVVSDSESAGCPIVATPRLVVTKHCPVNPVPPGGVLNFSGTVSNAGNITLTNVVVVNDQPTNNTPVFGPVVLAPGQSANFSGSYTVCRICCPPFVDTLTATGASACNGSNVTATATAACPGITTPQLAVRVDCPPQPPRQGELLIYSGSVSNSGDVVLTDVLVTDDQNGYVAQISALAPRETAGFISSFTPTNCGPSFAFNVTGTARNACTGDFISDQLNALCSVLCLNTPPSQLAIGNPHLGENGFEFSFHAESGVTYTVQYSLRLVPSDWQPLTNFVGGGGTAVIQAPTTNGQCYYRVLVQ